MAIFERNGYKILYALGTPVYPRNIGTCIEQYLKNMRAAKIFYRLIIMPKVSHIKDVLVGVCALLSDVT